MFNYIDLFAGAGGMSFGFEKAGFKNVFANEIEDSFAETYKYNFPNNKLLIKDISTVTKQEIEALTENKNVDVIIGGPPCQGFSLAGRIGRTFIDDERNYLFKEFLRLVDIINPKIFVMENVARIISHDKGRTIATIQKSFEELGYSVNYKVLQAANFEIPQKRQRIFVVGTKKGTFNFPTTKDEIITVKDAIDDLPRLMSAQKSLVANHNAMNHSAQMLKKMSYVKDGGDRKQIPEALRPKSGDVRKYIRYESNAPSYPVTGDMRKVFHYNQNRALTARELARLQTFPDEFVFKGSSINVQQQVGNAVPPKLAYEVAKQVQNTLKDVERNERISESQLHRQ